MNPPSIRLFLYHVLWFSFLAKLTHLNIWFCDTNRNVYIVYPHFATDEFSLFSLTYSPVNVYLCVVKKKKKKNKKCLLNAGISMPFHSVLPFQKLIKMLLLAVAFSFVFLFLV